MISQRKARSVHGSVMQRASAPDRWTFPEIALPYGRDIGGALTFRPLCPADMRSSKGTKRVTWKARS